MAFDFQNTDAVSYLKMLDANSIDLILTDPPYIISKKSGMQDARKAAADRAAAGLEKHKNHQLAVQTEFGEWDSNFTMETLEEVLKDSFRVMRQGGTIIVFFDLWKITPLKDLLEKCGFRQLRFIEWIKSNPVPINSKVNYLTNSREIALTAVKGGKCTFNSQYDNGIYTYPIYKGPLGDRFHPTQKSLPLFEELVLKHSNEGDVVLDHFSGSATTGIAALKHKRNFAGCEIDPVYFEKALARLKMVETKCVIPAII